MANIDYRDLLWQVRAELPSVPAPALFFNYAEAVRQFFSRSKAWQYNCPTALSLAVDTDWPTVTEGTDIPTNTYVIEPVSVKWSDGAIVPFRTRDSLDQMDGDWEQATGARPEYWTITGPGSWRMYPLLSTAATTAIYLRVALAPKVNIDVSATSIPEYLANEFADAWAHGALSRLMKMPGKDWSNPAQAGAYLQMFEQDIKMAKSRAAADFGRPDRTVQYGGLGIGGSHGRFIDDYGK